MRFYEFSFIHFSCACGCVTQVALPTLDVQEDSCNIYNETERPAQLWVVRCRCARWVCVCVVLCSFGFASTISFYLIRFDCIRMWNRPSHTCVVHQYVWSERIMLIFYIPSAAFNSSQNGMGMIWKSVSEWLVLARCFSLPLWIASRLTCDSYMSVYLSTYRLTVFVTRCVPFFQYTYFPFAWAYRGLRVCVCVCVCARSFEKFLCDRQFFGFFESSSYWSFVV